MKIHHPRTYYRMIKHGLCGPSNPYEPKVWKQMRQLSGHILLDIGANEGLYSLGLSKNFKKVIAYEPNPDIFDRLTRNCHNKPNITPQKIAISDMDGKTMLYLDDTLNRCTGSCDSILKVFEYAPASQPQTYKKTYQSDKGVMVQTRSLDSLFPHAYIELVKIDVEGAEFMVLNGARQLLQSKRLLNVIVELHNRYQADALLKLFSEYGYTGRWLDLDHYHAFIKAF